MSNLIVKDNKLIQASYKLEIAEQRIILLAIIQAKEIEHEITDKSYLKITAESYANHFNIEKKSAYDVIKKASENLFNRYISYNENEENHKVRWVDKIGYKKNNGYIYMRLTKEIIPLITNLKKQFTSYEIKQIENLSSIHAIRLYELLIAWRSTGKTPEIKLIDFRNKLGIEKNKYKKMCDFKKYVLDLGIKQINEHTDITAKYEQIKEGRTITGFKFTFKQKKKAEKTAKQETPNRDKNVIDWINNKTDQEQEIIKANADAYIAKMNITDEKHKQNIYRKAEKEEWGLEQYQAEQKAEQEQKAKHRAEQKAEKEKQDKYKAEKEKAHAETERYFNQFVSLNDKEQKEIINIMMNNLGCFKKAFEKAFKKDIKALLDNQFAYTFKKSMKEYEKNKSNENIK